MNKNLQKKLNAYAAAAGTLAIAGAADAQVIYTDINPDTIVHDTVTTTVDMDNDGSPELRFETVLYMGSSAVARIATVEVLGDTNNAITGSLYSNMYPFPYAMNNGDSIRGANNWINQPVNSGVQYLGVAYGTYTFCNFINQNDKYLGVRFRIGTNTHYGWVRLSVDANADTVIVKDYAYELLPGVGLTAGQTVGIHEQQNSNINIFSSASTVVIRDPEAEQGGSVRILNTMGQEVYSGEITDETTRISLEGNPVGIYFVEVKRNDVVVTQKVYIY